MPRALARTALVACAGLALHGLAAPAPAEARPRPPVVLIVFDEFPTTSLLGRGGRIDRVRYPNFAALADHSTWFRNATTVHDSTFVALPAILTGRIPRYRPEGPPPARRSLFTLLARRGYRIHGSEEGARVCPQRLCGPRHSTRWYLIRSRLARFDEFVRGIQPSRRPYLHFKQTLLPHVPWIYLPSGHQYSRGPFGPIRGINSELGAGDRGLVRLAQQRHLLQVGAVDRILGRLLRRLVATGLWQRSLVVVTADHGISFRLGERDRRTLTPHNVQGVAPVPLFVKRPGQRRGRVSRAYARTVDVLPTVAAVLRLRVPWRLRGRSVFSAAVARRRTVRIGGRAEKSPVVKLRARSFQGRWRRAVAHQHWLFGFGDDGPGLYGIGPGRDLIGRPVGRVAPAGHTRAALIGAGDLRSVELRRRFLPVFVAGRIRGSAGRGRELAVALNGRIVAAATTFRLRRRGPESFACVVPEAALVPGRNTVEVLLVERSGRGPRLRLIGRS